MTPSAGISEETKQILVSLGRLEENMKHLTKKMDEFGKVSDMATQTEQSVKSAHNRIDDIKVDFAKELLKQEKDFDAKMATQKETFTELKNNIVWLQRSVLTGFIGGGIGLIFFAIKYFVEN
ncbi:hypothetical protein NYE67_20735 [Solibacillus sp. FSL W8-0474]|uniref:hypothetical protein n=1 Tax=Solibacillus sp. FSL W8-0474 TaxID=2975336 RepID=UPI0030F91BD6